jgi:hypothetical protein
MQYPGLPANELARLKALQRYNILDTLPEEVYEDITHMAIEMTGIPIVIISLVDHNRVWFKSKRGIAFQEAPREYAFCAHAILHPDEIMVVPDARYDERFYDNPLTTGESSVVFYAGVPIIDAQGYALGTLAMFDNRPRVLSEEKLLTLKLLAKMVQKNLELRIIKMAFQESRDIILVAQPLVNTILHEVQMLANVNLVSAQAHQIALLNDTVIAFKTLIEHPGSFPELQPASGI